MAIQSLLMIIGILAILLVIGVPISYSIGIASLVTILQTVPLDISVVTGAQRIFVGMSKFSLTGHPLLHFGGQPDEPRGIAKRLVNFVMAILGKLPGALLVTNVGRQRLVRGHLRLRLRRRGRCGLYGPGGRGRAGL